MSEIKLLNASAGSGKTYALAYQYIKIVIENPSLYRNILAVTFTNKATEEMKSRIILRIWELSTGKQSPYMDSLLRDTSLSDNRIRSRAKEVLGAILHDYSNFAILTIDKFFQRIIRSFIKELGIDVNFNLELKTDSLLESASDNLIEDVTTDNNLKEWIIEFVSDLIADGKKWDIRDKIALLGKEIFRENINIEPNFSKQSLKESIDKILFKKEEIVSNITAIGIECRELIAQSGLSVDDFSYGKSGVAGFFNKIASGDIAACNSYVLKAMDDDSKWHSPKSQRQADVTDLKNTLLPKLREICLKIKTEYRFLISTELITTHYRNFALLADLKGKMEQICHKENIMPISQTSKILSRLLSDNDAPFIFEKTGSRFTQFMIDEFQDTSRLQWNNFVPLLRNASSQSQTESILIVGDLKQSIYRWRSGDWRIMAEDIGKEFDVTQAELSVNHRSDKVVVDFNNLIISSIVEKDNDNINKVLSVNEQMSGHVDTIKNVYKNTLQTSRHEHNEGYVTVTEYESKDENGDKIAPPIIERIEALQRQGYKASDIAVIVRYNDEATKIAALLMEHKAQNSDPAMSYDIITQEALLIGNSSVVRFIVAIFSLVLDGEDPIAKAIYNRFLDRDVNQALEQNDSLSLLSMLSPLEALESVVRSYNLSNHKESAFIEALSDQIIDFSNGTIADLKLFVSWWKESGHKESISIPEGGNAIIITTIHKSKGLEFKAVILPYCEWDLNPSRKSMLWVKSDDERLSELPLMPVSFKKDCAGSLFDKEYLQEVTLSHVDNINLLYVALTRPRSELHIYTPKSRPADNIGTLLISSIADVSTKLNAITTQTDRMTLYEFGAPTSPKTQTASTNMIDVPYAVNIHPNLRMSLNNKLSESGAEHSAREEGIILHSLFEQSRTKEDIFANLDNLISNAAINVDHAKSIRDNIEDMFSNKLVAQWFSDVWDMRLESAIIVPQSNSLKRPDRVLINGKRAIVIDYKFGSEKPAKYRRQIERYASLLSDMGYDSVEGYLWFVTINQIERIV